ncbi:MAG: extracellular solute-binding protein [Candidatus Gracilibacteria bacterium]
MNSFKKTSLVLILILILLVIGYCSLFRKKEQPPPIDSTEKSLVIYNMYDSEDVFAPLIQQYLTKNPYSRITYKSFSNFEEYEKRILNELAEGEGPDIFAMPNSWFVKNKKKLVPMPVAQGTPETFRSLFVDVAAKDLVITDAGGVEQVYGIPLYVDTLGIYYNKDQFEDAIPTRGKPAATWSGIKDDVYLLTKDGAAANQFDVSGIAMGVTNNVSYAVDVLFALMIQNGTQFYNDNMSEATFSSASVGATRPAVDALEFYVSFADKAQKHYSWNKYMAGDYDKGDVSAFAAGEVSMIFGYSTTYEEILKEVNRLKSDVDTVIKDDAIGTALFPQLVDPSVSTEKRDTFANYFAFGVARTSEFSDAAWDFLTFLATPESEKFYFEETHKPTSLRSLIPEQSNDPIYGSFAKQVGYAESFPVIDYIGFREQFTSVIDAVNNGKSTGTVLTSLQDEITAMLPTGGYIVPIDPGYESELL